MHRISGGIQPQPDPLLSQHLPVVPCPPTTQQRAQLWLYSCSPGCYGTPAAGPHWLIPRSCPVAPRGKKLLGKLWKQPGPGWCSGDRAPLQKGQCVPMAFSFSARCCDKTEVLAAGPGCSLCQGGWQGWLAHLAPAAWPCCTHSQAPSLTLGCSS